jgi:DNA mismatch repair protein MutH
MVDFNSAESIIDYAKELKNQTLRTVCGCEIEKHGYKGKGNFGQILEKFYFGYEPNSDSEPDFKEVGIELKTSPLKKLLRNYEYRSKERLVLNIINYCEVHKEDFENSSFWKKNAHLLIIFYLHDNDLDILDYCIKLVDTWKYPNEDLKIIRNDWEIINQKIKDGKAHELSEGDTFYLGACTKGSTALSSFRKQPFNTEKAKQRAYSLKQGYVNHIIATISKNEDAIYGKLIESPEILDTAKSIEDFVIAKFQSFLGQSAEQIENKLEIELNKKAKNYFANITKSILGIELNKKIAEFEKADIVIRTIRVEINNRIEQSVSFPAFDFIRIYNENWRESELKDLIEKKFFFIFFKNNGHAYVLDKVKFWNMPYEDRNEVRRVWLKTKKVIQTGDIIHGYKTDKNGKKTRILNFPKKSESYVWHVRPHGLNADDTCRLPVKEKENNAEEFTKQCFWMNWDYLRDEIYLK